MNRIADQTRGLGQSFTELGKLIVPELLRKVNGKRILIDVKHMGPTGRCWYYNYLLNIKNTTGETIPIIASHMGVTGNPSNTRPNDTDPRVMDTAYANDKGNLFNLWDINLSGDDILAIHASGGLIGLNFDQRILSGVSMVDNLETISRHFKQSVTIIDDDGDEEEIPVPLHSILAYRAVWAQPLLENLLFIVKTVYDRNPANKEYAWKMVCIGSDFDGFINAIDAYCHAEDFQVLAFILKEHLKNRALVDPLLDGMDLDEIVNGFMNKNALRFLETHFV
jgi:microsomal dipeptidase-like Zn-dependent dipeptidase